MTDILLAHAFFLKNAPKQITKMRPYAPLGTLYVASSLRAQGYAVALFDAMFAASEEAFAASLQGRDAGRAAEQRRLAQAARQAMLTVHAEVEV